MRTCATSEGSRLRRAEPRGTRSSCGPTTSAGSAPRGGMMRSPTGCAALSTCGFRTSSAASQSCTRHCARCMCRCSAITTRRRAMATAARRSCEALQTWRKSSLSTTSTRLRAIAASLRRPVHAIAGAQVQSLFADRYAGKNRRELVCALLLELAGATEEAIGVRLRAQRGQHGGAVCERWIASVPDEEYANHRMRLASPLQRRMQTAPRRVRAGRLARPQPQILCARGPS